VVNRLQNLGGLNNPRIDDALVFAVVQNASHVMKADYTFEKNTTDASCKRKECKHHWS